MTKQTNKTTPTNIDRAAEAFELAHNILCERKALQDAASAQESIKRQIVAWHKAKLVIGRAGANGCLVANAIVDGLKSGALAGGTIRNYLTTVRESVKSGKWDGWNKSRSDAAGKGKGGRGKGKSEFSALLVRAFNHADGKSFVAVCKTVEQMYRDDKVKTMYAGFVEFLKSEGFEIKE